MADRTTRSETAWLSSKILTEPAAQALKQTLDADSLFQRLMFDRRGPTETYPSRDYEHKQPRTSASGNLLTKTGRSGWLPSSRPHCPGARCC